MMRKRVAGLMPPSQGPPVDDHQRRRRERQDLVRLAQANAERQAFELHREQVRLAQDAPPAPHRGPAGCVALILVPTGLLLLTVHPLPGMVVLTLGAMAYLMGSHHLDRTRQKLEQADTEADLRWRNEEGRRWQRRGLR